MLNQAALIGRAIFETLGISLEDIELPSLDGEWLKLDFELNPKMCGPVAKMFTQLSCMVTYTVDNEKGPAVNYCWGYQHPRGGRNGYSYTEVYDQETDSFRKQV